MAVFKCKMCGGTIEFEQGASVGVCDSCGTKQTLPKVSDDTLANLFNRANNLRLKCEFDKAATIYEKIVEQDDAEAEAHWGIVLCKYGIEYVDDPATGKKIPTCHRTLFDAVTADADYQSAIDYADPTQQSMYEAEARAIDRIQKDILAIVKNEKPFDVFICYKETDKNGKRTQDSVIANDIYYQLTQEGFKVFYAAITLEDKLGQEYEPYIFAALNSAKVMLVVGTDPMYFNAVWVRNEWSRYLRLMKTDRNKLLIPCYRDMDAYELPEEFAHLQAQDMSKIGFINDVVRGIKKVLSAGNTETAAKETVVVNGANTNTAPLLKRAFMFLEDGAWQEANDYCEKVLDIDPENAQAYLGKLMAELRVKNREDLKNCAQPFNNRNYYQKALRFADPALADELKGYTSQITERSSADIYKNAVCTMNKADSEEDFSVAANLFESIKAYKDAGVLAEQCFEKAETFWKEDTYNLAKTYMADDTIFSYEKAIEFLQSIPGWRDGNEQIERCKRRIEEIKIKKEAARKKRKKIFAITAPIVAACTVFIIVLTTVIIPSIKYNAAVALMNEGKYDEAITAFDSIHKNYYYRDSDVKIENCRNAKQYNSAVALMTEGKYEKAIKTFESLQGYQDSAIQIENCQTALKDSAYNAAVALMNEGKYEKAIKTFESLQGYQDSAIQIENCQTALKDSAYNAAVALMNEDKHDEAITAFEAMDGYKDSDQQIIECRYDAAVELMNEGRYDEAITAFEAMDGYKDSVQKAEEAFELLKAEKLKDPKIGNTIYYGQYEQDNNTSNGKEDIEWLVLAKEGSKILVISDQALDCQPYNTKDTDVTWETCSLRTWLNGTFLNNAFSTDEQTQIQNTTVFADKNPIRSTNPGKATADRVFLLSITEAEKYFKTVEARECVSTAYANANGANYNIRGNCRWWLRSPGEFQNDAASVDYDGYTDEFGHRVDVKYGCVRPAMWIDLGN